MMAGCRAVEQGVMRRTDFLDLRYHCDKCIEHNEALCNYRHGQVDLACVHQSCSHDGLQQAIEGFLEVFIGNHLSPCLRVPLCVMGVRAA